MIALRPYQSECTDGVRAAFAAGYAAPLVVSPTGSGKTVMFAYMASGAARLGRRVVIVEHRIELVKGTCKTLANLGVPFGVIHPDYKPSYAAPVQVASVQTLANRIDALTENGFVPDILIFDEAHHGTAGMWKKVRAFWPAPKTRVVGFTATPIRTDGQGLGHKHTGGLYDKLIIGPQVKELIDLGFLVAPDVYAPAKQVDLAGINLADRSEEAVRELEARVDRADVIGDAVAHYRKLSDGAPAVAFCISITHARHVAEQFSAAGYAAFAVSGKTPKRQRERILKGLETGATQIVCTCDLISEGTDIPALGCAIMLRPTHSLSLYLQQVGRILRPCAGKARAVLLDHVGNVLRHLMPDEPREWSLDGAVKERKARKGEPVPPPKYSTCGACFAVHAPAPACPRCGEVYPEPTPEAEPQAAEGELKQITEEIRARIMNAKELEIANARTLEDLQTIANLRNYPPGWATNTWKMRAKMRNRELFEEVL